jgi:hypothetical protein
VLLPRICQPGDAAAVLLLMSAGDIGSGNYTFKVAHGQ